ncbi:hypothetical protein [Anaeroselena agilis]|uniref:Uncharacterized protein n=1 Tax=Anaeroselena agilis TaxID=3063788 RepID=A0ABU3NUX8_9FIRM|nr:hypothetical protein [Selenomonadales bacterium 4137-cl]
MKFRVREATDFLYLVFADIGGLSAAELHRNARRAAKFGIDYHYVVQRNGLVEAGRDPAAVAGGDLENNKTAVYVLVDGGPKGKPTDAQQVGLKKLLEELQKAHPQAKLKKVR